MQLKFTASAIARIPLSDRGQQFIWDTQLAGLGLSVGTKSKSYIAQFRGKRTTLGRVDDLTLGDARSKALEYIESIKVVGIRVQNGQPSEPRPSDCPL